MTVRNHTLSPERRRNRQIDRAWESAVSGRPLQARELRPVVLASWRRSQDHQVSPDLQRAPLDMRRLSEARRQRRELILAAQPILLETAELLRDSRGIVLLCGADGMVLESVGARRTLDIAFDAHIAPGGIWSEQTCGTNAVGTALREGRPVELSGEEHYCDCIRRWTCAASLLRQPDTGRIIGALDLTYDGRADGSILPLSVTVARRIEGELARRSLKRRQFLLDRYVGRVARYAQDAVLLLDGDGSLLAWNPVAMNVLSSRGCRVELTRGMRFDPALGQLPVENHEALSLDGEYVGVIVVVAAGAGMGAASTTSSATGETIGHMPARLRDGERKAILSALKAEGGRRGRAARRLGISRTTLYRRLLAYGLQAADK